MLTERVGQFRTLLTGQWSLSVTGGPLPSTLTRFSIMWWAVLASILILCAGGIWSTVYRSWRPPRIAGFLLALVTGVVLISGLFPESGRMHHLMLSYPFVHCAIVITFLWTLEQLRIRAPRAARLARGMAGIALIATAASTVANMRWYSREIRKTGGIKHSASEISDLAAWVRTHPEKHYIFCSWGLFNPVFSLSQGRITGHEYYFQMTVPQLDAGTRRDVHRMVADRDSVFVFSNIMPEYARVKQKWFALAAEDGLRPGLVKQFWSQYDRVLLYELYAFEPLAGKHAPESPRTESR